MLQVNWGIAIREKKTVKNMADFQQVDIKIMHFLNTTILII